MEERGRGREFPENPSRIEPLNLVGRASWRAVARLRDRGPARQEPRPTKPAAVHGKDENENEAGNEAD